MSTHKAVATRCLSYHQVASGQPAIRALAMAPLRRLALGMLFTIMTTSYQTTLYSLREIFNKRQHANANLHRVEFSHYDNTPLRSYTPPGTPHMVNERAVRILLECILVLENCGKIWDWRPQRIIAIYMCMYMCTVRNK